MNMEIMYACCIVNHARLQHVHQCDAPTEEPSSKGNSYHVDLLHAKAVSSAIHRLKLAYAYEPQQDMRGSPEHFL